MSYKKTILIILFLVLLAPNILASLKEYNQLGGNNSYYQSDTGVASGFFSNPTKSGVTTDSEILTSPQFIPLIDDLDGDGINEIVVVDSNTFKLFHSTNGDISLIESEAGNVSGFPTFMIYDIDEDGYKEILATSSGVGAIDILEYNGTSFHRQVSHNMLTSNGGGIINCKDTENCAVVYSNSFGTGGTAIISGMFFNSTTTGAVTQFASDGSNTNDGYCFSRQPTLVVADYDDDAEDEYIFTYMHFAQSGGADPSDTRHIVIFEVNDTNIVKSEVNITLQFGQDWSDFDTTGCNDNVKDYGGKFTNPLVFDAIIGGNLETIVGIMKDDDEFVMYSYDSIGTIIDRHPDILDADGRIVSNVIRANAFTDTGNTDFCVLGFRDVEQDLDLLCSKLMGSGQDDEEYNFDLHIGQDIDGNTNGLNNVYNISTTFGLFTNMIHAVEHKSVTETGDARSEILTTYGIFEIDQNLILDDELLLIYENPKTDGAILSVDVEKNGREDLVFMTSTNLWYIDDGFTNSGADISDIEFNPCYTSTWKQNTTVEIGIVASDTDGDKVSVRAYLYNNNVSGIAHDSGWSANVTSGTTVTFSFTANLTTSSDVVRIIARDTGQPSLIDEELRSMSVATNGVEFGDITCSETGLGDTNVTPSPNPRFCSNDNDCLTGFVCVINECVVNPDPQANNTFDQTVTRISNASGLGSMLVWVLIMLIIAIVLWMQLGEKNPTTTMGIIAFLEVGMFIIGVKLGYIPFGILLVLVIGGVISMAMWIKKTFFGD